jgi:hypothetical protein
VAPAQPVAPNKGTLQSSTWVFGSSNWTETWFSPNQKYQFEDIISIDPNGVRTDALRVARKSDGSSVYSIGSIPLANWGFSPDDDRLFYETLNPTLNFVEIKVFDLAVSPAVQIVQTNPSVGATSAFNGFSPSGAYFIYYFIDKRPSTSAPNMEEVNLQVYKIQGVTQNTVILQRYLPLALTPGAGRTFAIGFSPDSPESSIVYEYATGATTTGTITNVTTKQWTMETLPNPLVHQATDTITAYDFWRYSPCGDKIALVKQASQTATDVYLYDTTTGLHLSAVRVDAGNVGVFPMTTAQGHYARYIDTSTNLNNYIPMAPNACVGGKWPPPLPNTPSGTSITLADHNTATQDGVSIVFDSVTVAGDSNIQFITNVSGPPPPRGFEILGNPSVYFDITTSATFTGDITICISYAALPPTITTPTTMLHYVGTAPNGSWQDVTFFNDVTNREICGRASSLSPFVIGSFVTVAPPDTTPPVISNVPANFTAQATTSAGVVVSYVSPVANDAVSGVVPVTCVPASGSTFALGTTTVACTASDAAGNIATAGFAVNVADTTPPVISNVPASMTAQAMSSSGAVVSYTTPAANDAVSGVVPVTCLPATGSTFALGTTAVACTASDAAGNVATAGFDVSVVDTTPPVISNVPANLTVQATSGAGAVVSYTTPAGNDALSGVVPVTCLPASGSTFALGTMAVVCTASDAAGNVATAGFSVSVVDTTPPVISNVPANLTVQTTSGAGALVSYTTPAGNDAVSGVVPVTCVPSSGSTFALGTTTVACTARDAAGNQASAGFTVSVIDTTPPLISNVPANLTVQATSSTGAVVSYVNPVANDAVSGVVPVTCVPASGSTFAIGTTMVACSARDSAGNLANAGFTVTVNPLNTGAPIVRLSRSTLYFGDEESRENQVKTEVLSNTGTALLVISSINVTGDFNRVSARRGDCGGTLPAGAFCSIAIRFSPTGSGLRRGILTINTNAADSPYSVGLIGRSESDQPSNHPDWEGSTNE